MLTITMFFMLLCNDQIIISDNTRYLSWRIRVKIHCNEMITLLTFIFCFCEFSFKDTFISPCIWKTEFYFTSMDMRY